MADIELNAEVTMTAIGKPGIKTTEFWKSVVVHLVAVLVIAYGMHKQSDQIVGFGTILMGLTAGTYNIGRSMEKSNINKLTSALLKEKSDA